jgi:hypothetical protein
MLCYHIIPFSVTDDAFVDDCRVLGNVLHRLRVPRRVEQAAGLNAQGLAIEAYELLPEAVAWLRAYARRGLEGA